MKKNDIIELKIDDIGVDGSGIGKVDGMTFFVKDAVIGDRVSAKVMKLKKNYGYARFMELLEASPFRVEPKCPLYRKCGGCQIQALSYEKQLEYKENKIRNNLMRIGGFVEDGIPMEPIIGMKDAYHYRNKAQFPVGRDKEGNIISGFYAARTHSMIPVENCYLGVPQNQEVMERVLGWMNQYQIEPYDETNGLGLIRHVLIRYGFRTGQLMVCLVINGKSLPKSEPLIDSLLRIKGMASITISINRQRNNVIMGNVVKTLWGADYIEDFIGDVKFCISPLSFYQINPVQTEVLYQKVLEYAELNGDEVVWDLYCGIGTISLFLARHARKVYGVEIVPQAVEDARQNARINGIENAVFFVGKAEEVLEKTCGVGAAVGKNEEDGDGGVREKAVQEDFTVEKEREGERWAEEEKMMWPQVVVVDPPRKGCQERLLESIVRVKPEKVVYVSCDSATLARDLKYLRGNGYEMKRGVGIDQFCQTVHVETVVLLTHEKATSYIEVTMDYDTIVSEYKPKVKVTYKMIMDYIKEKYNLNVHSTTIAEIKRSLGLKVGDYNKKDDANYRKEKITPEKRKAVEETLRYFEIIQ